METKNNLEQHILFSPELRRMLDDLKWRRAEKKNSSSATRGDDLKEDPENRPMEEQKEESQGQTKEELIFGSVEDAGEFLKEKEIQQSPESSSDISLPDSNPPDDECPNDPMPMAGIREAALNYVREGFSIVPVRLGTKRPPAEWTVYQGRLPNEAEINNWFSGNHYHTNFQLAVVCGCISGGLIIFDFDGEQWCDEALAIFLERFPEFRDTRRVRTGSGRVHLWVICRSLPSSLNKRVRRFEGSQIELRANRHITLAPPSLHPNGNHYSFENLEDAILEISEERLNEIIAWMGEGRTRRERQPDNTYDGVLPELNSDREARLAQFYVRKVLRDVENGTDRNDKGYELARYLNDLRIPVEDAVQYMESYRSQVPTRDHEYTTDEVLNSLHSAYSNEPGTPWIPEGFFGPNNEEFSEERIEQILNFNPTDAGNAETFLEIHGSRYVFVPEKKIWFMWDGVRWFEEELEAMGSMLETIRIKYRLANGLENQDRRGGIQRWCRSSESAGKIKSGLEIARAMQHKSFRLFDTDPYLFCCQNGVIDLKTGEFRHVNHNDWLHKSTGVAYDPHAQCPIWLQFLDEIFPGDRELIPFIKRAVGYSLTGDITEQCLFVCHGTGANGKSTFLDMLGDVLGEYGQTMPASTLKEKKNDDIPNDVARMCGARFIKMIEVKERTRLNVERIKSLTGGDKVVARFLHQEYFEFYPQFKLWLAVNHKPVIKDTTESIWRRIMLIPFNAYFPPERQDKHLVEILREERSGILNWAIQGCLEWQREGLQPPRIVMEATRAYRNESDVIGRFLEDECIAGGEVEFGGLYRVFERWWRQGEEGDPISRKRLAKELVERGYRKDNRPQVVYNGLSLRPLPDRVESEYFGN